MMGENHEEVKNSPEEALGGIASTDEEHSVELQQAGLPSEEDTMPSVEKPEEIAQEIGISLEGRASTLAQRFYATGRRKEAIARVWLIPGGKGNIIVNDTPISEYLCRYSLVRHAIEPFIVTQTFGLFDVKATAKGGGLTGQAGALRHGIARALVAYDPSLRPILRKAGLLTRDPRVKERKKYGRKRARRGFQFRKR